MSSSRDTAKIASRLRGGFIAAAPVPFDRDGHFVESAQANYAAYLSAEPVSGVAVWAHTGRGLHLDEPLADEVLASWRSALTGRLVVAGAGAPIESAAALSDDPSADDDYIELAVRMAERAAAGGADAILCYAPARFRDRPGPDRRQLIVRYHAALAAAGLPLIAFFLYDAAGGVSYTIDELRGLFALPDVCALKMATLDSVCTFQDVAKLVSSEFPDKVLVSGEDRFLGYSFLRGATGALVGLGAACSAFQVRLLESLRKEPAAFLELLERVDQLAECTFIEPLEGYIQRMLHVLVELEILPATAAFDPWCAEISAAERDTIRSVVNELREVGIV